MRFGVLGPVAVWTGGGEPVRVAEARARMLLADLLVHEGRPVAAERLIDDLWGGDPPANPAGALQTRVWTLRRALEDAEPGGRALVESGPGGYALRAGADTVDARRFDLLAARARRLPDPAERAAGLADALALWRGPALADVADRGFARPYAARLEEGRLAVWEEYAEARLGAGEHAAVAADLTELVDHHPLRERLQAAYLRALYGAGRQADALAAYDRLRARLAEELGVDPGPELRALQATILRQDPALTPPPPPTAPARAPAPAATGAQRARAALPVPLTALVGRDADLDRVGALLRAHRLVTLTGPGGVGKTRLALAAAARAGDAALVELGALDPAPPGADAQASAARVAEAAAAALGVRDDAAGPPRAAADRTAGRLAAALSGERLLLVLDNCEHVVAEAAALADLLLARAPGLRVLATSREPLGLTGEVLWPVAPLDVPPAGADDPDRVAASGAARLFAERAAAGVPGFAVDADTAAAVAAVCRRLDGLPLALELAAARVRALGVATLAERLDDRFHLLTMGARGAPSRQRTLRAVIDWSWEPLTEAERTVLRRLSVHADGCTLAAAEEVCAGGGVARGEVLDLLTRLVDRSLTAVSPTPDGPRYRLLESVAAYGAERLAEAGEAGDVRARHDAYYTRLAEEAAPALRGGGQRAWLRRLDAESAGLRSALDGAAGRGDADTALRLVDALAWYWYLRGRLGEAERALECALAVPGGDPSLRARVAAWRDGVAMLRNGGARPPGVGADAPAAIGDPLERARAEWFLLHAQAGFGDLADSGARLDRVLAVFRAHGDRWGTAAALQARASQGLVRGAVDAFERDATESAALFCELGDDWGTLLAMGGLGLLAEITGDYDRAAELHREGVRLAEELGLWSAAGAKLAALGRVALLRGDFAAAEEAHERARRMAVEQADVPGEQFAEIGLALGARRQGRLDAAEGYLRRWADWLRRLDGDPGLALVLAELGFAAEQRGDAAAALALHLDGLAAARATGDARAVALALEGLAGARSIGGEPEAAARLLGTAEALRASVGVPLPPAERGDVDRVAARVAAAVGAGVLAAELRRGRAMAPEDHPGVPAGAPHRGGAGAGVRPEGAPAGGP